jgi:transaldolase
MPAAFRSPMPVEQLAGGEFYSTIHPKVQAAVEEADRAAGLERRPLAGEPVDGAAVGRVARALPEFLQAYEADGLSPEEFDSYGAVTMTLDAFDTEGWQKLIGLK